MARKRKQTEKAPVTLAELPRDAEALTNEEAEAAKGGWTMMYYRGQTPEQQTQEDDEVIDVFPEKGLSPSQQARG
jgi:hypothetical protein